MITQKRLKELLSYDPATGVFVYLGVNSEAEYVNKSQMAWYKRNEGNAAGYLNHGYVRISIDGKQYEAHRLAFLYMEGYIPEQVDHIDHNESNNPYSNLRPATDLINSKNRTISILNKSGVTGVYWNKANNNWRVKIGVNMKLVEIGSYKNYFEAVCARKSAERRFGFHENHGSSS